jgi:hypothetical protein
MLLREPSRWIFDSKLLVCGWLALAVQLGAQRDCIVVPNPSFHSEDRLVEVSGRPLPLFLQDQVMFHFTACFCHLGRYFRKLAEKNFYLAKFTSICIMSSNLKIFDKFIDSSGKSYQYF